LKYFYDIAIFLSSTALEKKKQQEQLRLLKEQEKLQRQEQMRMDRELRAQQILEVCISNQKSSFTTTFCNFFVKRSTCTIKIHIVGIDFTFVVITTNLSTFLLFW
jgi:hypothetical protein